MFKAIKNYFEQKRIKAQQQKEKVEYYENQQASVFVKVYFVDGHVSEYKIFDTGSAFLHEDGTITYRTAVENLVQLYELFIDQWMKEGYKDWKTKTYYFPSQITKTVMGKVTTSTKDKSS